MHRYVKNQYTGQYKATIGADFLPKQITIHKNTPQNVTLQIWDTAGQERFQSLGNSFYRGADACILVFDVFDKNSFDGLDKWKKEFMNTTSNNNSQNDFPFIVMGNKADKESTSSDQRQVSNEEALHWCRSSGGGGIPYFETSAKSGLNVEAAFLKIATVAFERSEKKRMMESPFGGGVGGGNGMMMGGNNGGRMMKGYVPPHQTVDLNRNYQSYGQNNDCC
jgi:Ras-related protein Rab-7A